MADTVEKEELRVLDSAHEHDPACCHNNAQRDASQDPNDVEDDIAGASQLDVLENRDRVEHVVGLAVGANGGNL